MAERKFRISIDPAGLIPEKRGRGAYILTIITIVLTTLLIGGAIAAKVLPQRVPLLMSLPWGEERLVPNIYLLSLPLLALITLVVNLVIGRAVKDEEMERMALAVGTLVVGLMVLVSCLGILQSIL